MSIHFHTHIFNAILGYCDDTLRSARYIIIIKKRLLKCVYTSLKNRFSAIKSTLKVELCLFMSQHKRQSANVAHIRACNSREVRVLCYPKMVPDNLSNALVYGCQFHITGRCHTSLLYAEHGRMFPPTSLEARDMILNRADGYMWHVGVRFHWSHV